MRGKCGLSALENCLNSALSCYMTQQASPTGLNSQHAPVSLWSSFLTLFGKPYNIPICPAVFFLISQNPTWQTSVTEKM